MMRAKIAFYLLILLNLFSYLQVGVKNIITGDTYTHMYGTYALSGILALFALMITFKVKAWKAIFGFFLLSMVFSPYFLPFGLSIGAFFGSIQVIGLLLLIIHLRLNPELWTAALGAIRSQPSEEEKATAKRAAIDRFKRKFEGRDEAELKMLATDASRTEEARIAAQELLDEG